ncbi:MAG: ribonuclease J [Erysipelotrichales bacterium]|nr:ribonuclease J [Erysipelotrichales bacterium]
MSTIKIFAFGGVGENGKNMYAVEVDEDIFILDSGLKYPNVELYGIDKILPDMTYLKNNAERVKAVFLSHAHDDHIGAVPHLMSIVKCPIYASRFTIEMLKDLFREEEFDYRGLKLITVDEDKMLKFDNVKISVFYTTHSIPESIGIILWTKDGLIVYTGNYTFEQNIDANFRTSFNKLTEIAGKKILVCMSDSLGADKIGSEYNYHNMMRKLNSIFNRSEKRLIFTVFSSDLRRIQKIIDMAQLNERKVAIIGRRTQRVIDIGVKTGYLKIPKDLFVNLRFIDEKNKNLIDNLVVLVTGDRHEPFYMLQRMCRKIDRLVHIDENDEIVIMTIPVPGTEKMAARTYDMLSKNNAKVTIFKRNDLQSGHAYKEEIKLLYNIINPRYLVPVIGEYRHQYAHKELAMEMGYLDNDVIELDNGYAAKFENGIYQGKDVLFSAKEILIDGSSVLDLNEVVIKDRESLATDGVMLIISNVDARNKKILTGPEIVTRGFLHDENYDEIQKEIQVMFKEVAQKHFAERFINWMEFKNDVKSGANKIFFKRNRGRPVIIPAVISTEPKSQKNTN